VLPQNAATSELLYNTNVLGQGGGRAGLIGLDSVQGKNGAVGPGGGNIEGVAPWPQRQQSLNPDTLEDRLDVFLDQLEDAKSQLQDQIDNDQLASGYRQSLMTQLSYVLHEMAWLEGTLDRGLYHGVSPNPGAGFPGVFTPIPHSLSSSSWLYPGFSAHPPQSYGSTTDPFLAGFTPLSASPTHASAQNSKNRNNNNNNNNNNNGGGGGGGGGGGNPSTNPPSQTTESGLGSVMDTAAGSAAPDVSGGGKSTPAPAPQLVTTTLSGLLQGSSNVVTLDLAPSTPKPSVDVGVTSLPSVRTSVDVAVQAMTSTSAPGGQGQRVTPINEETGDEGSNSPGAGGGGGGGSSNGKVRRSRSLEVSTAADVEGKAPPLGDEEENTTLKVVIGNDSTPPSSYHHGNGTASQSTDAPVTTT
jgi:hypothetical protein